MKIRRRRQVVSACCGASLRYGFFHVHPHRSFCTNCGAEDKGVEVTSAVRKRFKLFGIAIALLCFPALSLAQQPSPCRCKPEPMITSDRVIKIEPVDQATTFMTLATGACPCEPAAITALVSTPLPKQPRYDWSFIRDWKFHTGVGFSFGVTSYDISTSHGFESTRFYRGADGQLNRGKYLGITALTNVALLPLDLQRDHRWRWVSFGLRVGLAGWRMKAALRNGGRR